MSQMGSDYVLTNPKKFGILRLHKHHMANQQSS